MPTKMNPPVFWGASALVAALLALGVVAPKQSEVLFAAAQDAVIGAFGWFYILAVAVFLAFIVGLAFSRYGSLRLGADDDEPEFTWLSWIAMLFAAGMGIGLMYFAVAEPIQHYSAPPEAAPRTFESAREAMVITFTHWGLHAWAIYALVGLSLAYFTHRRGLPLTLRSGLRPLLGRHTDGALGHAVDIFAVCGTLFGIATSLGFGVTQINAGLEHLTGLPNTPLVQVGLIAAVMAMATVSVVTGLDAGIRRLSELNLICAIALMVFVLAVGPTSFLLKAFVQNIGAYLDHFFIRTFNLYAYEPRGWMSAWTLFYWAWWIAWSPFVGMFIARISKGRTVREFVIGVLAVPTGFSFLWMTVFGDTAIALDMGRAAGTLSREVADNLSVALFQFFEYLPFGAVASGLAVALITIFFITSADSGSLVIDTIASGGAEETPIWQRVYWCALEGLTAALLLLAGGLQALQTATLISALPFTIIMIALMAGLVGGMRADPAVARPGPRPSPGVGEPPWRHRLARLFAPAHRDEIDAYIRDVAAPALTAVAEEIALTGRAEASVDTAGEGVSLTVGDVFRYDVRPASRRLPAFSPLEATLPARRQPVSWEARASLGDPKRGYDVAGFTRAQLIEDVLEKLQAAG